MEKKIKKQLTTFLSSFVTTQRLDKMYQTLSQRTRYLTVVLEDIYQPHNASAVLRSCDAFGVQDVHIIENRNTYRVNPGVALGSSQWLSLHRYNTGESNTPGAIETLRNKGYRIVATTPHSNDINLEDFDLESGKTALIFGTEMHGLSKEVISRADTFLKIPMYGFVESYNISVSCAVILHHLTYRLRESSLNWQLEMDQKDEILLDWLKKSLKKSDLYEKKFYEERGIKNTIGL